MNLLLRVFYLRYDFVNGDGDPRDDNGHGTHVSGTIGMVGNNAVGATGVNWNVKIMAVKALDAGNHLTLDDALEAYSYVLLMKNPLASAAPARFSL